MRIFGIIEHTNYFNKCYVVTFAAWWKWWKTTKFFFNLNWSKNQIMFVYIRLYLGFHFFLTQLMTWNRKKCISKFQAYLIPIFIGCSQNGNVSHSGYRKYHVFANMSRFANIQLQQYPLLSKHVMKMLNNFFYVFLHILSLVPLQDIE